MVVSNQNRHWCSQLFPLDMIWPLLLKIFLLMLCVRFILLFLNIYLYIFIKYLNQMDIQHIEIVSLDYSS